MTTLALSSRRPLLRVRALPFPRPELAALLVLSAVLDLWSLSANGYANEYYSAAVRSMTESWHAFLYGSFDAGGVMTVDKPPLALWVQALSARLFGFGPWSLLVPQALMGIGTVALTYDLVRRRFGRVAGFAGGLTLALTPITVAISRHNNPDALLVLCAVGAVWALVRALEDGRTRWLVLCGACVGLGFEAKMAAALLVVPGIATAYAYVAPRGRLTALRQLVAGGATAVAAGGAWPLLVALTPAGSRPWISGTSDNSIWSLILGYNGLGRLFGQQGGPGGAGGGPGGAGGGPGGAGGGPGGAGGGPGGAGGGPGGLFGGDAGPLRLLNQALGGQAGWWLGFAVVGGLAVLLATRGRREDHRTGWLVAVGGGFLTVAVAFSQASGIFHPYYVSLLAPFTAALVGAGVDRMLAGGPAMRVLGPLTIAGGVACELAILGAEPASLAWLAPGLVAGGSVAVAALATGLGARVRAGVVAGVMALLLLAPATWAVQTLGHGANGTFPAGGPAAAMGGGPGGARRGDGRGVLPGGPPPGAAGAGFPAGPPPGAGPGAGTAAPGGAAFGGDGQSLTEALAYAKAHGGGTVAVSSQNGAAGHLITDRAGVAAIGGFSGRESQVSAAWLAGAVDAGRIRYVLTGSGGNGMPQDDRVGSTDVMAKVAKACTPVGTVDGLYDCTGRTAALRAER